ncbi:MAG: diacylglycerol kinase family lipid kinase [Lachnospiraceae bacterium]|nr:diacylglycerol kinase family lipid kinase [Lachnospiraceae bacterium]
MHYFIINPKSQSGHAYSLWKEVQRTIEKKSTSLTYRYVYTRYPGHMTEIVKRLTSSKTPKHIIIIGGDGSFNEAVNGLQNPKIHCLSFLPAGSGNDLGRSLGFPKEIPTLLARILPADFKKSVDFKEPSVSTDPKKLDLGVISWKTALECHDSSNCRSFAVSSGIGFDAAICEEINTSRLKGFFNRFHAGKLAYLMIGIKQLLVWKPQTALLYIDDAKVPIRLSSFLFLSAHIHPFEGGGFPFCPDADYEDGFLDLCVVSGINRFRAFPLIPFAKQGRHIGKKGVHSFRCKKMRIVLKSPLPVHTDGEIPCHSRFLFIKQTKTGYYFK